MVGGVTTPSVGVGLVIEYMGIVCKYIQWNLLASVPRPSPLRVNVRVFKSGKAWDETSREG